ncbi:MAG: hypothetical protein ACTTHG_02920 [Treponemataceae bacterium]
MKKRKRELAKVGIFGSIENPVIVTEKDLQEIAQTFPEIKTAPVKLGNHWTDDNPRLGNVVSVSYDKETQILSGEIEEHDNLAKAVDDGFYPDVSIGAKRRAIDGKMYLNHLAYLGDEAPAVKDLYKEISSELNQEQLSASDRGDFLIIPSFMCKKLYLSDNFITLQDLQKNNEKVSGIQASVDSYPNLTEASIPLFNKKEEASMTENEIKAIQKENEKLKQESARKDKLLSDTFVQKHLAEKEQLRKVAEGKITVPQMENLMNLADSFENGKVIELSDGSSKRNVSPISVLSEIFQSLPKKVEEGALNLSDTITGQERVMPLCSKMLSNI